MSKEKIVISGIAGSGGSYLAEYIIENHPEVEVHGLSRWHSSSNQDNLKDIKDKVFMHECDLLDLSSIIRTLKEVNPSKIFHLASHANVRKCFDTPLAVLNNNIMSTANLLEAIRLTCPETILQMCSTSEVYGNPLTFPMTEDHPMKPVNPYSVSKLAQEALSYSYFKSWGLKVVITRAFAYINPRRADLFATAFAYQIARIEKGHQKILKHGNLDSIRTLIDVRDMMRAYWIASEKCEYGVPYNIGGKDVLSVGDFLEILCKNSMFVIHKEQDKTLLRPVDVTKQVCDTSKFDDLTGFRPKYSLEESTQFLLNHCRKEIK
jgi:GDPmannose 4,6-dehydratase/GDP-4-dehydro-6-deoxy-D-mannose reductase